MSRIQLIVLTFLFGKSVVLGGLGAVAQPTPDTLRFDSTGVYDNVERVLDDRISDAQVTEQAAEHLTRLTENPLDVNHASVSELSVIPGLSPTLARRIVQFRREQESFARLDALTDVEGLDARRLRAIRPYLTITPDASLDEDSSTPYPAPPSLNTMWDNLDLDVIQRLTRDVDLGRGFEQDTSRTTYQGSPERLTTRIRLNYERHLQLALTLDKDPGEPFHWDPSTDTYGFDHVAGNVTFRDWGRLKTLVLGDFAVEYGQGAALWQGLAFGKGRDPVSPLLRDGRGIVPFQSTSENRFFRGLATEVAITPRLSVSGFVSRRHRDASLASSTSADSTMNGPPPARTLSTGGRHRTPSEIRRKNAFGKTTAGGAVEYRNGVFHVGMTAHQSWFDRPLRPPPNRPDEQFAVSGTHTGMVSLFGNAFLDPYTLFGEVARSPSGAYGGIAGTALDHDAGVQAIIVGRRFPRDFAGLYNAAIGESGSTQNEFGVYTGLRLRLAKRWRIGGYVDQYRFPWLRFNVPRPSEGLDARLVVDYEPRPWLSTYIQLRAEREETGAKRPGPDGRSLGTVHSEHRQSARWHTEYDFSDNFTLRTRIQLSRYSVRGEEPSHGILISQGFRVRPSASLQLDARLAFFDTDGFESRIYTYEHDLLYSFSVPVLFDRGHRSYLLTQYEPTSSITIEAKYGVTWYPHRKTIGSGLNELEGNRSREIRIQLRWRY